MSAPRALPNGTGTEHKRHKSEHKKHKKCGPRTFFCAFCVLSCASCVPFPFCCAKPWKGEFQPAFDAIDDDELDRVALRFQSRDSPQLRSSVAASRRRD